MSLLQLEVAEVTTSGSFASPVFKLLQQGCVCRLGLAAVFSLEPFTASSRQYDLWLVTGQRNLYELVQDVAYAFGPSVRSYVA